LNLMAEHLDWNLYGFEGLTALRKTKNSRLGLILGWREVDDLIESILVRHIADGIPYMQILTMYYIFKMEREAKVKGVRWLEYSKLDSRETTLDYQAKHAVETIAIQRQRNYEEDRIKYLVRQKKAAAEERNELLMAMREKRKRREQFEEKVRAMELQAIIKQHLLEENVAASEVDQLATRNIETLVMSTESRHVRYERWMSVRRTQLDDNKAYQNFENFRDFMANYVYMNDEHYVVKKVDSHVGKDLEWIINEHKNHGDQCAVNVRSRRWLNERIHFLLEKEEMNVSQHAELEMLYSQLESEDKMCKQFESIDQELDTRMYSILLEEYSQRTLLCHWNLEMDNGIGDGYGNVDYENLPTPKSPTEMRWYMLIGPTGDICYGCEKCMDVLSTKAGLMKQDKMSVLLRSLEYDRGPILQKFDDEDRKEVANAYSDAKNACLSEHCKAMKMEYFKLMDLATGPVNVGKGYCVYVYKTYFATRFQLRKRNLLIREFYSALVKMKQYMISRVAHAVVDPGMFAKIKAHDFIKIRGLIDTQDTSNDRILFDDRYNEMIKGIGWLWNKKGEVFKLAQIEWEKRMHNVKRYIPRLPEDSTRTYIMQTHGLALEEASQFARWSSFI